MEGGHSCLTSSFSSASVVIAGFLAAASLLVCLCLACTLVFVVLFVNKIKDLGLQAENVKLGRKRKNISSTCQVCSCPKGVKKEDKEDEEEEGNEEEGEGNNNRRESRDTVSIVRNEEEGVTKVGGSTGVSINSGVSFHENYSRSYVLTGCENKQVIKDCCEKEPVQLEKQGKSPENGSVDEKEGWDFIPNAVESAQPKPLGVRNSSRGIAVGEASVGSERHLDGKRDKDPSDGAQKRDPYDPRRRNGALTWDDYFMSVAFLSAQRSKDPNRQVGACIVGDDNVILGIGYNGFPRRISDDDLPWSKAAVDGDSLKTKYPYVCHAEVNAILNRNHAFTRSQRMYVTMFPCNECAKLIIQSGIVEVVFFTDKRGRKEGQAAPDPSYAASRLLLSLANIKVWQHKPQMNTLHIDFE